MPLQGRLTMVDRPEVLQVLASGVWRVLWRVCEQARVGFGIDGIHVVLAVDSGLGGMISGE